MDELLQRLEKLDIGFCVGHEWYGGFCNADDLKLLCPRGKGIQKIITVCGEFVREYGVRFNIKTSMCMLYTRNRNRHFEDMRSIKLEMYLLNTHMGSKCEVSWNLYVISNLSEDTEVRYKQRDFMSRF